MKLEFNCKQALLLLISTTFASSISVSPTNAATFSTANTFLEFNFSSSLDNPDDSQDPKSTTTSDVGFAVAEADADTNFGSVNGSLILANLDARAEAAGGLGNDYFGYAQGTTNVLGNFSVSTAQELAFTFRGWLDLETFLETPQIENVSAFGKISFWLQDSFSGEVYNNFEILGSLPAINIEKTDSFFDYQASKNIEVNVDPFLVLEEQNQLIQANFEGIFQRSFEQDTELSLVAVNTANSCVRASEKINQCVRVPENYSSIIGLLSISAVGILSRVIKQVV